MKNLLRNLTLVAVSVLAFSCSDEENKNLPSTSITKLLAASSNTTLFNEALTITGMDAMLDAPGTYTVFVPTDDAITAVLGGQTLEDFDTANPGVLESIIKNHIVNSAILTKDLTEGQLISTSLGQNISVDLEDNIYYPTIDPELGAYEQKSIFLNADGTGRIFARDAKASNGTINIIDGVLMPTIGG